MSWLFTSGDQNTGASVSTSVLPMSVSGLISLKIDWFDLHAVKAVSNTCSCHKESHPPPHTYFRSNRCSKLLQLKQQLWLGDPPAQSSLPPRIPLEDHIIYFCSLKPFQDRTKVNHTWKPASSVLSMEFQACLRMEPEPVTFLD